MFPSCYNFATIYFVNTIRSIVIIFILSVAVLAGAGFFFLANHSIDVSVLEQHGAGRPTIVLDDTGKEWMRFQLDRRDPVPLSMISDHLIQAFLAAEDWGFFEHAGISWRGILRSIAVNMYHGRRVQGASTITQQLIKLLFFNAKKTFSRKIKEQLYALIIEQQFSKQQILELYLNHVYFGCGIYGVEAAAQRFWKKSAAQVTIDEAAALACIIRSPGNYCPLLCPLSCERRRDVVLQAMHKRKVITKEQYDAAVATPVSLVDEDAQLCGRHVKEMIRQELQELVGKNQLYTGGYVVQTTFNQNMQGQAERIFSDEILRIRKELRKPADGGLISFDVKTGEIKTMVGGANFRESQFNRALQARRQLGSGFKPIVYAAAIERGMSFADVEIDEPICVIQDQTEWEPKNFNRQFNGPVTRAYALSRSNNIVTVKTLLDTGISNVIALAKRFHLQGPFAPYPSLALGCVDVTLKESAAMFNLFANDGVYVEPYSIAWIKDRWGTKMYNHKICKERVLSSCVVGKVAKVLELSLKRVRKWFEDRWIDSEAISKTGTTNESRTCWYLGSTPSLTTAVYVGCDDNQPLGKNVYPITTAFPIWLAFNRVVSSDEKKFSYDPPLQVITIHEKTGKRCRCDDPDAIEIFV